MNIIFGTGSTSQGFLPIRFFRVSLYSGVSSSSQGSCQDDGDASGDVLIWREGIGNGPKNQEEM